MNYTKFVSIMEKHIHKDEKRSLLKKIAENPDRFVGIYRSTNSLAKLNQNLSQSREIRFGDGLEEVIEEMISYMGYYNINKKIKGLDGSDLNLDQYFKDRNDNYYFIEQKVRDDHDSTKKRGQIDNFKKKQEALINLNGNIIGIMYFVDPGLKKNKNYYINELETFSNTNKTEAKIFYGKEFFEFMGRSDLFEKLEEWLINWKNTLPTVLNLNFDEDSIGTFEEIKYLEKKYWKKLINNNDLWNQNIIQTLFPNAKVLNTMVDYFDDIGWIEEKKSLNSKIYEYYKI